jgi:hypothetical protein
MREIKFRFFDTTLKEMFSQNQIEDYTLEQINRFSSTDDRYTKVMQFTGCINKQDVEIYEGDIVEDSPSYKYLNGEYIRGVVVSHYYKFVVSYTHPDGAVFYDELDSSFIVVGNIHQHAHLLENK